MRDYRFIDQYLTSLYSDIYTQPEDVGHTRLAQKVIDHWGSRLTTCHSVLDVGCGQGFAQPMWERWGMEYYGCAIGEDVIKAQELGRRVVVADFSFLTGWEDNKVDLIFARHALEHSPMPLLTLFEWARVARNWLGIVLPAPEWYGFTGQNHYSVMTHEQIENLLNRAGWNIMWSEVDSLPFDASKPDETLRPHEYWYFCEKKRG